MNSQFIQAVPSENGLEFNRLAVFGGFFHCFEQGNGDDAFGHIGPGRLAGFEAARKILDVILVFAGMMTLAFKTKIIILLPLERFDDRLFADFPRVTQLVIIRLTGAVRAARR